MRCPFFEKKVRGINELKEIYYKVQNATVKSKTAEQFEYTKWLNQEKYCQWLINEKIIEFILIENPHVELIKRSTEIMRLLALDERYFTVDIVDMLWVCCSQKHEDIVRSTLDLVQDLANFMPLDMLGYFSSKLRSLKENEFDEKLVSFLKNYTLNTMKNIKRLRLESGKGIVSSLMTKKREVKIDDSKYIDLILFW